MILNHVANLGRQYVNWLQNIHLGVIPEEDAEDEDEDDDEEDGFYLKNIYY